MQKSVKGQILVYGVVCDIWGRFVITKPGNWELGHFSTWGTVSGGKEMW
jgi:hypothetical protein